MIGVEFCPQLFQSKTFPRFPRFQLGELNIGAGVLGRKYGSKLVAEGVE